MKPLDRSIHLKILILVVAAYSVMMVCLVAKNSIIRDPGDAIEYIEGSQHLTEYDSAYHPPFYPIAIAALAQIVDDSFLAAKIVSMISSVLIILTIYALAITCFKDRSIALSASVLVAASPILINLGYTVHSDSLGTALFLACTYALARSTDSPVKWTIFAGFLAGLAYLTRYVYVSIIPAAALLLLIVQPGKLKNRLSKFALFFFPFLLVIAPWSIVNIFRHGSLHNMNHINIAFSIFDKTNSWLLFEEYEKEFPTLFSLVSSHPIAVLRHWAKNAFHFPSAVVVKSCLLIGIFAIFGIFQVILKPTIERMALFINGVSLLCLILLAWLELRFFAPLIPLIILLGCYFVLNHLARSAGDYWPKNSPPSTSLSKIPLRSFVLFACFAVSIGYCVYKVPIDLERGNINDEANAGEIIDSMIPANASLLTSSRRLAWYANRPFVNMNALGTVSPEDLEKAVKAIGAAVLVYTKRHSIWTHPQLEFLLSPEDKRIPDSFHLLFHIGGDWPVVAYWVGPIPHESGFEGSTSTFGD